MDLKIDLHSIEMKKMRYPTVGDWWWNGFMKRSTKTLVIRVASMKNPDYMFLVALHELVEAWLCYRRKIREQDVTRFDIEFERKRQGDRSEPGDDPSAPYFREHQFATAIEKQVARELGVNWEEYDKAVADL